MNLLIYTVFAFVEHKQDILLNMSHKPYKLIKKIQKYYVWQSNGEVTSNF